MLTSQDWRKLRYPLITLGGTLVFIGLLVSLADQYQTKNTQALQQRQHLNQQARQKYETSGLEKEMIVQYLPLYYDLLAGGFIGEERRIEWIEQLRLIHHQYHLFSIDYNISLQEEFTPSFVTNMGGFVMNRSTMKLDLDLLHEGDLMHMLEGLQQQVTPFIVRECEITKPLGTKMNTQKITANLKSSCHIDWLTLRDPELGKGGQ